MIVIAIAATALTCACDVAPVLVVLVDQRLRPEQQSQPRHQLALTDRHTDAKHQVNTTNLYAHKNKRNLV